jgi:hypothetical protein
LIADEHLMELTLEELHFEYQATVDAGGGDFTQEFTERVLHLLQYGLR